MSDEMVADPKFDAAMDRRAREVAPMFKPSKLLYAAADILGKGWCQGAMGQRDLDGRAFMLGTECFQPGAEIDRVCLMGAILKAAVDLAGVGYAPLYPNDLLTPDTAERAAMLTSYQIAEHAVSKRLNDGGLVCEYDVAYLATATWNDRKGRTQADVIEVVRATAASEEAAGR